MPMTCEEKLEKIQRLETAHKKSKNMLENESLSRDLHPGTDIAQKWQLITATYSGLEQTLKYIIADEKFLTIKELICGGTSSGNVEGCSNQKNPYKTHDLKRLFCYLEDSTKIALRSYYGQFQSLHSYIEIKELEKIFGEISGSKGNGYESWRYTLIQDEMELPTISVEAMIAIWGCCIEIGSARIYEKDRVMMLDEKLRWQFWQCFQMCMNEVLIRQQDAGQPFQDPYPELITHFEQFGDKLNFFAQILWHYYRYKTHGLTDASDQLSEIVKLWVYRVLDYRENSGISSYRWFVERALGNTPSGESIRLNTETQRFEDVPWSLRNRCSETLSESAVEVKHPTSSGSIDKLRVAAKESGLEVRENRAFTRLTSSKKENWHCVMEVFDITSNKLVVTIWQKKRTFSQTRGFQFLEECPRESMSPSIQRWININRAILCIEEKCS